MGGEVGYSMTEARHGVMLLGEEFGVHLPRGITSFIASLGPVGAAMEAAFPFLAIIVGATLLLEHLSKVREEGQALTQSQMNFGTTVANVLNGLNEKLLQAGIRTDELNHNHLAALNKQLQLIDLQSFTQLEQSFGTLAKAADATFAELKTNWYQWGAGSAGAKHALDEFKGKYDLLLAQGKDKEANDLLAGTRQSAEHVLALMKQAKDNQTVTGTQGTHNGDYQKYEQAKNELKKQGIGFTEKEVEAQGYLVDSLQAQAKAQELVNQLKAADKSNARQTTQGAEGQDADKAAREQAQAQQKGMEEAEKLWEENYHRAVSALQESEREKIAATREGSAARLAAINAASKEEESKGLQETQFYKGLLTQRVQTIKQMAEEENKIRAEAGKEAAEHELRMGELRVAANKQSDQLYLSGLRNSASEREAVERAEAQEELEIKQKALAKDIAALDKSGKDYENKLKQLQDKQKELVKENENQITQIREKAEMDRNARILSADNRFTDEMSRNLTSLLMRHQTFSKMMISLGDQVVGGMIQNAIKSILANNMTKESDAASAARSAFLAGEKTIPGIGGVILGGALAAGAYAKTMSFESGGIVPGVGKGDTVPAMLEPGEGVLSNKVMEKLGNVAKFGSDSGGGQEVHIHHHITNHISAMDRTDFERVLDNHADSLQKHATRALRRMNK
jgi:hypothetical protein